jgi:hypothetical protein
MTAVVLGLLRGAAAAPKRVIDATGVAISEIHLHSEKTAAE